MKDNMNSYGGQKIENANLSYLFGYSHMCIYPGS